MRYKPVPEPRSLDDLFAICDAVPLVPSQTEDCCARIVARTDVAGRDRARTWLTFLTALGLVRDNDRGFYRVRDRPDRSALGDRFLAGVFGAREIHTIVAEVEPIDADAVYDAFRASVPDWERNRRTDWESTWRERTGRLLEWGVTLGELSRTADGEFRAADPA